MFYLSTICPSGQPVHVAYILTEYPHHFDLTVITDWSRLTVDARIMIIHAISDHHKVQKPMMV